MLFEANGRSSYIWSDRYLKSTNVKLVSVFYTNLRNSAPIELKLKQTGCLIQPQHATVKHDRDLSIVLFEVLLLASWKCRGIRATKFDGGVCAQDVRARLMSDHKHGLCGEWRGSRSKLS